MCVFCQRKFTAYYSLSLDLSCVVNQNIDQIGDKVTFWQPFTQHSVHFHFVPRLCLRHVTGSTKKGSAFVSALVELRAFQSDCKNIESILQVFKYQSKKCHVLKVPKHGRLNIKEHQNGHFDLYRREPYNSNVIWPESFRRSRKAYPSALVTHMQVKCIRVLHCETCFAPHFELSVATLPVVSVTHDFITWCGQAGQGQKAIMRGLGQVSSHNSSWIKC